MAKIPNIKTLGISSFITLSAVIGAPITAAYEGISLVPYYDSVGVKTWCRGETEVSFKKEYTVADCDLMYNIRYGYFSYTTARLYNEKANEVVTPNVHAAMVDMAYNLGITTMIKSTMIKKLNEGNITEACNAILLYKKAGGIDCSKPNNTCSGIWQRRIKIKDLCLGVK